MPFLIFADLATFEPQAKAQLSRIRETHPRVDAYLVYSNPHGQARFDAGLLEVFQEFPKLFDVSDADRAGVARALVDAQERKKKAEELQSLLPPEDFAKELGASKEQHDEALERLEEFPLTEDLLVELRFKSLDFELIAILQKSHLVDRERTLASAASIRIVLGPIRGFGKPAVSVT